MINDKRSFLRAIKDASHVYIDVKVAGVEGFVRISKPEAIRFFTIAMDDAPRAGSFAFMQGPHLYIGD